MKDTYTAPREGDRFDRLALLTCDGLERDANGRLRCDLASVDGRMDKVAVDAVQFKKGVLAASVSFSRETSGTFRMNYPEAFQVIGGGDGSAIACKATSPMKMEHGNDKKLVTMKDPSIVVLECTEEP